MLLKNLLKDLVLKLHSHEILLRKKVSLHRYLVAVRCDSNDDDIRKFIKDNYPGVIILDKNPKSASQITHILKHEKS